MRVIYFRYDKEVIYFCEKLFRLNEEIEVQWKRDKHWGNELRINDEHVSLNDIILCFVEVFLFDRYHKMIKKIARETYYYSDDEEIERISQLTDFIISEKSYQKELFGEHESLANFIFYVLKENMEESSNPIHFDSFVTFCMQPISECIEKAVGFGIDEMKREEEYQNFVHSVRHYLRNRKSKTDVLHILQGEDFTFYNEKGEKYTRIQLRRLMHREPLYLIGLDENELNISPVITLLPEKIYVYGDNPSEAKTLALINLFEERVQFFPLEKFPFHINIK